MAKKKKTKTSSQTAQPKTLPPWLSLATFIALGILIFYPPFFRGLFFKEDMFVFHVFTAIVFTLIWVQKIYKKDYSLLRNPLDWAVLAYMIAYLLSLIGAVHPGEAFYGFLRVLNLFMIYWMVTQVVRNYEAFETIVKILIAAGTGVAVIGILAATGYSDYSSAFDGGVISSTLQYPNATAAYLAVISFLAISLIVIEKRILTKIILVILCTLSKGAWLIFIFGAILLLIGMPGLSRITSLYALGVAFVAAGITYTKFHPAMIAQELALPYLLIGFLIVVIGQLIWEGLVLLSRRINLKVMIITSSLIALITLGIGSAFFLGGSSFEASSITNELSRFTNLGDSSYTFRADFISWGIDIIKDYPINGAGADGWNALYHQYQDYLYFTTEAHNHFIQVGVEAGLVGLTAFIAIWVFLALIAYRAYNREKKEANIKGQVLIWGTFTASVALGLHAAMDFDLSFTSLALLLWVLLGLISAAIYFNTEENDAKGTVPIASPALNIGIALLCILTLIFFGSSSYLGYLNALEGGKAVLAMTSDKSPEDQNEKFQSAREHYEKAIKLDPNNAEYFTDLAYVYAIQYTSLKKIDHELTDIVYQETIKVMEKADKLKGHDIKIRSSLINTAHMLGDFELTLKQAEKAVQSNPNDIEAYDALTLILVSGLNLYQEINDTEQVMIVATKLANIEGRIEKQKTKLNYEKNYWIGNPLELSDNHLKGIAKANYLLGDYNKSLVTYEECLGYNPEVTEAVPNQDLEAFAWYGASLYKTGNTYKAEKLANQLKEINEDSYNIYLELVKD